MLLDLVVVASEPALEPVLVPVPVPVPVPARQLVGCKMADWVYMRSSAVAVVLGCAQGDLEAQDSNSSDVCVVGLALDAERFVRKAAILEVEETGRAGTEEA